MITNLTKNLCDDFHRNVVATSPFTEEEISRMEWFSRLHRGENFFFFEIKIHILYFDTKNRDAIQFAQETWIKESELEAWIADPQRKISKMEYYRSI